LSRRGFSKTEKLKVDGDFGSSGKNELKGEILDRKTESREELI